MFTRPPRSLPRGWRRWRSPRCWRWPLVAAAPGQARRGRPRMPSRTSPRRSISRSTTSARSTATGLSRTPPSTTTRAGSMRSTGRAPRWSTRCAPPFQVINEVMDPELWSTAVGCSRLAPVRGVPAVTFGDALMLLTAESLITLADDTGDAAAATAAAEQLRPVGAALSDRGAAAAGAGCPADRGDRLREEPWTIISAPPNPSRDPCRPDPSAGAGLHSGSTGRWSASLVGLPWKARGRRGGRRARCHPGDSAGDQLRAGPRPAVIGLVWKVFGSKFTPAPIAAIEEEAGEVFVPWAMRRSPGRPSGSSTWPRSIRPNQA